MFNKTAPPIVDKTIITRNGLTKALELNNDCSAFWIGAPAGSGKTSFISCYQKQKGKQCLWYRMDAGDNDTSTFFYYLGNAWKALFGDHTPSLNFLTSEYLMDVETFGLRFFESLYSSLKRPIWLVLDNYQEIEESSPLTPILAKAIELSPNDFTIVFISRNEPHPHMSRLIANRTLRHIESSQMALSVEECTTLAQRLNCKWTHDDILKIHRRTKGWAAGVILCSLNQKSNFSMEHTRAITDLNIANYFKIEILEKCTSDIRKFLFKSSLLPYMTREVAEALTGMNAGKIIDQLVQKNFFIELRRSTSVSYQFHPLFREFLLSNVSQVMPLESLRNLTDKAAQLMIQKGDIENAVILYKQNKSYDNIIEIILSQAQQLNNQGRTSTLLRWIDYLPPQQKNTHPWLLFWQGVCHMHIEPLEGQKFMKKALESFSSEKMTFGLVLAWSLLVETYLIIRGSFYGLDPLIIKGLELEKQVSEWDDPNIKARFLCSLLLSLCLRKPDHEVFYTIQNQCEQLVHHISDQQVLSSTGSYLIMSYVWNGQTNRAELLIKRLYPVLKRPDTTHIVKINFYTTFSIAHIMRGDWETARRTIAKALEVSNKEGIHIFDFVIYAYSAYIGLLTNDLKFSSKNIKKMEWFLLPHAISDTGQFNFVAGAIALSAGNLSKANFHIDKNIELSEACGFPYAYAFSHIFNALLNLEYQHTELSKKILDHMRETNLVKTSEHICFLYYLLRADTAFIENKIQDMLAYLKTALVQLKKYGIMMPIGFNRERLASMMYCALEANLEPQIVNKMIHRLQLTPPPLKYTKELWAWNNRVYFLGEIQIYRFEEKQAMSPKTPQKILELMKLLICLKGKNISKETVADLLWPDSEGDKAIQNLDTTLYRLRRLFGGKKSVILEKGYLKLNRSLVWVDSWYFESLIDKAEITPDRLVKIKHLSKAVALYKGDFHYNQNDNPVILNYSQQLKILFQESGKRLAELKKQRIC